MILKNNNYSHHLFDMIFTKSRLNTIDPCDNNNFLTDTPSRCMHIFIYLFIYLIIFISPLGWFSVDLRSRCFYPLLTHPLHAFISLFVFISPLGWFSVDLCCRCFRLHGPQPHERGQRYTIKQFSYYLSVTFLSTYHLSTYLSSIYLPSTA